MSFSRLIDVAVVSMDDGDDKRRGTRFGARYRLLDERSAALHLACHAAPASASTDEQLRFGGEALARLFAQGLPWVDGPRGREVDGFEVLNFCRAVEDDAWRLGMVSEFRRMCGAYEAALRRRERGEESRARFVVRHRRRWYFEDRPVGAPVRLSFDLPVDDTLRRTVAVAVSDDGGCRATVSADAVVLRGVVPPARVIDAEIRIEAVLDCESPQPNDRVSEPAATWLADDEPGIPCTDRVRALARAWTEGCEEPLAKIRALWDELERRVLPGFTHPEDAALDPLELGWADCKSSSSLLVALTRSLGIPARLVSGMLLVRERPSDFHFWMEAWLPDRGWTPFDWHAAASLSAVSHERERWQAVYFGRLDYRLIHARYPKPFASVTGVRFPRFWYREDTGALTRRSCHYRDAWRRPISTDTFEIEELSWI